MTMRFICNSALPLLWFLFQYCADAVSLNGMSGLKMKLTTEQTITKLTSRIALLEEENARLIEEASDYAQLLKEVQILRRKAYLNQVRKESCSLGGFLGSDDSWEASAKGYDERWKSCYPQKVKAHYCMSNAASKYGKKIDGDCGLSPTVRLPGYEYAPPPGKLPKSASLASMATPAVRPMGAPYFPLQFARGVFEVMQMTVNDATPYWDMRALSAELELIANNDDAGPVGYPDSHKDVQGAIDTIGGLTGKTVLVVGSISPWVEAIVLHNNATSVTTVDYNMPMLAPDLRKNVPELLVREMTELMASGDMYDVILSYSSIEHDGLGRYGDPINPDGDLAAQKEIFLMLKPEGKYILGVPGRAKDALYYISQRFYGPVRMPLLARGWNYNGLVAGGKPIKRFNLDTGRRGVSLDAHCVLLLTKPNPAASTLEETYDQEACALKCEDGGDCFPHSQTGEDC